MATINNAGDQQTKEDILKELHNESNESEDEEDLDLGIDKLS